MSNVIEHIFCSECMKEFTPEDGANPYMCPICDDIWNTAEGYSNTGLTSIILETQHNLADIRDEDFIGPLTKEDQEQYDCLSLWLQILIKEQSYRDDDEPCIDCKEEKGTIEKRCADCYWEEDSRRKYEYRHDPKWRFNRMMCFLTVVQGKSEDEAYNHACEVFRAEGIPIPV